MVWKKKELEEERKTWHKAPEEPPRIPEDDKPFTTMLKELQAKHDKEAQEEVKKKAAPLEKGPQPMEGVKEEAAPLEKGSKEFEEKKAAPLEKGPQPMEGEKEETEPLENLQALEKGKDAT